KILFAADNNLVVLGSGNQNPGGSLYSDWITFKIDTAGTLLWNKRYDKTTYNDEIPADMELDKKGNIFITGYGGPFPGGSNLGATQWVTLKYLPNGNLDWFLPIDTLSEYIAGTDLTIASDGSLFVIANLNSAIIHIVEFTGDGSCGTPANTSAINVSDDSAIVTWSAANGAYLYHLEYKPSTSTTWIKLSTDQTSYTLRSLFAGTQYDYHVQAICKGNPSTYSDTKQFTTTGAGYCNSRGLSTKNEWIDLVYLTDLINSTGNDSGYHDYTYRTATLIAGATHDLTLSAEFNGGGYTEAWSVWIDWNKDGDFEDANELIVRYNSQQIGWETTPFTVPVTALGVTKMRVAMARRNYSNPCDTFTRGEVEDYSINVVKQAFVAASGNAITNNAIMIAPNPAKDFLIVNLSSFHEKVSLLVCNAEGRTMLKQEVNNVSQTRLNISQLGKGLYLLRVADNKGGLKTFKFIKE
ncbi:MAG TPA: GEVED domain-containing protein, partial [Panacibacter sp.]|nr:GEVED domain-containing protein [Panacibacter sp.]